MRISALVRSVAALGVGLAAGGCHAEGSIKASGSGNDTRMETEENVSPTPSPQPSPPAQSAVTTAAPAPAPRTDACPLTCFEPQGAVRVPLTNEETTQLRSALEPVLGRMRQCTSDDDWRRRGSPTVNLRISPDGTLNELGVDPHHGLNSSCFEESARQSGVNVSLPTRKIVRCTERCVRDVAAAPARGTGERRVRRRGR